MREKQIHKLIEQQQPEEKAKTWENICAEVGFSSGKPVLAKNRQLKFALRAVFSFLCLCAVSLAVFLPIMMNDDNGRFGQADNYNYSFVSYTIKDYAENNNLEILYLPWYEKADCTTTVYTLKKDPNDILCLVEDLINHVTGELVTLYVTDKYTTMDFLESIYEVCHATDFRHQIDNVEVKVAYNSDGGSFSMFSYGDYKYCIYAEPFNEGGVDALSAAKEILSTRK